MYGIHIDEIYSLLIKLYHFFLDEYTVLGLETTLLVCCVGVCWYVGINGKYYQLSPKLGWFRAGTDIGNLPQRKINPETLCEKDIIFLSR